MRYRPDQELLRAQRKWETLNDTLLVVEPKERVRDLALTFPRLYGLRALDSFQLAAALVRGEAVPSSIRLFRCTFSGGSGEGRLPCRHLIGTMNLLTTKQHNHTHVPERALSFALSLHHARL